MPHQQSLGSSTTTEVNGSKPSSLFLQHLTSFPVVHDGINMLYDNPYGKKSASLADSGYSRFVKPMTGYLERPYSYVSPYVSRADELADSGLSQVEKRFPIVTESTDQVRDKMTSLAGSPFRMAGDGKDYVYKVYEEEYEKRKGGMLTPVKATITTALVVTMDTLSATAGYLGGKKDEAKDALNEKSGQAKDVANDKMNKAGDKMSKAGDHVTQQVNQASEKMNQQSY